jgi:hypothetical protein
MVWVTPKGCAVSGAAQITRTWIDLEALHDALDARRVDQRLSWRDLSRQLGIPPSFFTRMRDGSKPDMENICLLCDWLQASIDDFRAPLGKRLKRPAGIPDVLAFGDTSFAALDRLER